MGYRQFGEDDRLQIALLQAQGASVRQIAAALDRAPSTVARELKRNRSPAGKCLPGYAQQAAHARRWRGARQERHPGLRERVMTGFEWGWRMWLVVGAPGPAAPLDSPAPVSGYGAGFAGAGSGYRHVPVRPCGS